MRIPRRTTTTGLWRRTCLASPTGESFAFGGKLREQGSRFPRIRLVALRKFAHGAQNVGQTHGVGVEQRAAAKVGKSISRQINDIDVRGAQRDALFQYACAFIDQG